MKQESSADLARSVIEGIVQIVVQQVIAHGIMMGPRGDFWRQYRGDGSHDGGSLSAAYAAPATLASIAPFGAADAAVCGLAASNT